VTFDPCTRKGLRAVASARRWEDLDLDNRRAPVDDIKAPRVGLEPTTNGLTGSRSHELYLGELSGFVLLGHVWAKLRSVRQPQAHRLRRIVPPNGVP
jgi:hypothetical protein